MKHPICSVFGLAVLASDSLVSSASAVLSIDFVTVGNAGNAADTTGYGAVAYEYKIAKNETTIGQYAEFLNAVAKSDPYALYNPSMASTTKIAGISRSGSSGSYSYSPVAGSVNKPITYVSWFDAARFCNWMHNGEGSGSTETGAYTLNGAMSGIYTVNPGATAWIPGEDEWYKAAFYDATKGGTGGYWRYPTQSKTMTTNDIGVAGAANYYDANGFAVYTGSGDGRWGITDVGIYGANSDSFYGTNDQGGNVYEWNDAVVSGSSRGLRGGSYSSADIFFLASSYRDSNVPSLENANIGFRVATVPEPSGVVLTLLASGMLATRRKR
jgi:formylglycine-generating enzyme required for sulfatase activity